MKISKKTGYTLLVIWTSCSITLNASSNFEPPVLKPIPPKEYTVSYTVDAGQKAIDSPQKKFLPGFLLNFITNKLKREKPFKRKVTEIVTIEG